MRKINTYNESSLHLTLKKIYALDTDGECEVQLPGTNWICDVVCKNGDIVEIQTSNISALAEKTAFLLESGRKVRIVHPVIFEGKIETVTEDGIVLSRRKSPKKSTVYSVLRGITGIHQLLDNENLTIEILYVSVTETRIKKEDWTQLTNKSRIHLKKWVPGGKRLESILKSQLFSGTESWKRLFPESLPDEFTRQELYDAIFGSDFLIPDLLTEKFTATNRRAAAIWYTLLLWLGKKCNLIEECGKRGRKILYRLKIKKTNTMKME